MLSADIFEYYAKKAETLLAPEKVPVADPAEGEARVCDPLGVLLAIEPWNFPYYQIARIIAPQLSAGNTMLLKHAANVPQMRRRVRETDAGRRSAGRRVHESLCDALPGRDDHQ